MKFVTVYEKFSVPEFDLFPFQGDHTLQELWATIEGGSKVTRMVPCK
jgi:hypothetical protein